MTKRRQSARLYPLILALSVAAVLVFGAMAVSMLVEGAPAFPVNVFGAETARHRVASASVIRPASFNVLRQGALRRRDLLPLPLAVAAGAPPREASLDAVRSTDPAYHDAAVANRTAELEAARAAARRGDGDAAAELYDALMRTPAAGRALAVERASVLASLGMHERAVDGLRAALRTNPDDAALHVLAAQNAWWANQPFVADTLAGQALALQPSNVEARDLRRSVRQSAQPSLALARAWARDNPTGVERLLLARALVADEQHAAALAAYRQVIRNPALVTDSLLLEAASAAAAADSIAALTEFTTAYLERNPRDTDALLRLARAHAWAGNYTTALGYYGRIPRRDADFQFEVAQAMVWSDRAVEGATMLGEVVRSDPRRADAYKLLGDLAMWRGDLEAAERYYASAHGIDPAFEGLAAAMGGVRQAQEKALAGRLGVPADAYATAVNAFADNQGFRWFSAQGSRSHRVGRAAFTVVAQHHMLERGRDLGVSRNPGIGGRVDAAYDLGARMRLEGTLGLERYAAVKDFAVVGAGVTVYDLFDMRVAADVRYQPAAFRVASLAALQARATSASAGITVSAAPGAYAVWARGEVEQIRTIAGDVGRASVSASARRDVLPRVFMSAGVAATAHDRAAPVVTGLGSLFWAPRYYVEPSAGLGFRIPVARGVAAEAGVSAGFAFSEEQGTERRFRSGGVPTAGASLDLVARRGRWDVSIGASTGGSMAGGYRGASLRAQAGYRLGQ